MENEILKLKENFSREQLRNEIINVKLGECDKLLNESKLKIKILQNRKIYSKLS